jgi:hypothetical protein
MGIWSQQGNKLVGTGAAGNVLQVGSVALSADGNTAIVGGPADGLDLDVKRYAWFRGAAWVYTRRNGVWTQQGSKLVGADVGASQQGRSVALAADGNTAIVGGHGTGAAWVYTCSNGVWTQQGGNLIDVGASSQDWSVALSATPPSWAGLPMATVPERRGFTPTATVSGPNRAASWSAPAREPRTKAGPSRCPLTATPPSWAGLSK